MTYIIIILMVVVLERQIFRVIPLIIPARLMMNLENTNLYNRLLIMARMLLIECVVKFPTK